MQAVSMHSYEEIAPRLAQSKFRSRFRLGRRELVCIAEKGFPVIEAQCREIIRRRLGPAVIPNDGRQTPWRGHRASSPSTPPAAAAAAACANGTAYRKDGRSPTKRSPPSPRSCSAGSAPCRPEPASCRIRRICSDPKLLRRFAFLRKHDIFMTERKFQDKEECI